MPTHIHASKLNIHLVANERALNLLDHDYIVHAMQNTITNILGRDALPISLNLQLSPPHPHTHTYTHSPRLRTSLHRQIPLHTTHTTTQDISLPRQPVPRRLAPEKLHLHGCIPDHGQPHDWSINSEPNHTYNHTYQDQITI
jgi:hypothetical protein